MHFCTCGRLMLRHTENSILRFVCPICNTTSTPTPNDTLIKSGFATHSTANINSNDGILHRAAFDRVNKKVLYACEQCKIPFMTLVILSDITHLVCVCGYKKLYADVNDMLFT